VAIKSVVFLVNLPPFFVETNIGKAIAMSITHGLYTWHRFYFFPQIFCCQNLARLFKLRSTRFIMRGLQQTISEGPV